MQARSLGWEDPLEKERATPSRIHAWEIPWTEQHAIVHSVTKVSDTTYQHTHTHTFIPKDTRN